MLGIPPSHKDQYRDLGAMGRAGAGVEGAEDFLWRFAKGFRIVSSVALFQVPIYVVLVFQSLCKVSFLQYLFSSFFVMSLLSFFLC